VEATATLPEPLIEIVPFEVPLPVSNDTEF
jgi:hypothetical protein